MAEGGGDFGYDDPDLDFNIDNDGGDQNTTQPFFDPGASSTPYHGGEQHEMQTMQHENSGLPSYDERTPLLTDEELSRRLGELRKTAITGLLENSKCGRKPIE